MFWYTGDESGDAMPLTYLVATRLGKKLTGVRKNGALWWLRPDGLAPVLEWCSLVVAARRLGAGHRVHSAFGRVCQTQAWVKSTSAFIDVGAGDQGGPGICGTSLRTPCLRRTRWLHVWERFVRCSQEWYSLVVAVTQGDRVRSAC